MKIYYSQRQIRDFQFEICRQIQQSGWRPELIVGLARGGLHPAVDLSHYFDIPMRAQAIQLRDGIVEANEEISKMAYEGQNILIVDDINDTGASLRHIMDLWQQTYRADDLATWESRWHNTIRSAVLINNADSRMFVDYAGFEINKFENPEWCVFPWEHWWSISSYR
jgi:hypoxanthine phosphoribosyltransferase